MTNEEATFKIVSKEQKFWEIVKEQCEKQILESEQGLLILRQNLDLANKKIAELE